MSRTREVAALWRRSLDVENRHRTPLGALMADVSSKASHLPGFGVVVAVHELPAGSFEPAWLADETGLLLTPNGARTWNALLSLAIEVAAHAGEPGDLAAVVLHPDAVEAHRLALQGEKKEAA